MRTCHHNPTGMCAVCAAEFETLQASVVQLVENCFVLDQYYCRHDNPMTEAIGCRIRQMQAVVQPLATPPATYVSQSPFDRDPHSGITGSLLGYFAEATDEMGSLYHALLDTDVILNRVAAVSNHFQL